MERSAKKQFVRAVEYFAVIIYDRKSRAHTSGGRCAFGRFFRRVAKIALPLALTVATGGFAAPAAAGSLTAGSIAAGIGKSLAINALTGAVMGGGEKSSPVTGASVQTTQAPAQDAAAVAEEDAKKKRLALNASGSSGNTTSPLGVTGAANVTKRNLLGL